MSRVNFKKKQCPLSVILETLYLKLLLKQSMPNLRMSPVMSLVFFPMSIGFMSHVDFKKWPCHPFEFNGQGPHVDSLVLYRRLCNPGCATLERPERRGGGHFHRI